MGQEKMGHSFINGQVHNLIKSPLSIFKYSIAASQVILPSSNVHGLCPLVLHASMSVPLSQVPPSGVYVPVHIPSRGGGGRGEGGGGGGRGRGEGEGGGGKGEGEGRGGRRGGEDGYAMEVRGEGWVDDGRKVGCVRE